jgi:hypothetical protein
MNIVGTLTVGDISIIVTFIVTAVGGYHALRGHMRALEDKLMMHSDRMDSHEGRMLIHEDRLFDIAQNMQRIIGWQQRDEDDRRRPS